MANSVLNRFLNNGLSRQLPVLLLLLAGTAAHAQAWQTVVATSGTGSSNVTATAADASGNVYLAGTFAGTVSFGSTTLTARSATVSDLFVAKWSAEGGFAWVQQAGGAGADQPTAVAISGPSVYVTGFFNGPTSSFGSSMLTNTSAASTNDVFLAKLTDGGTTGTFNWAQQAGGFNNDQANVLAVSGSSVYVGGMFESTTFVLGGSKLPNTGVRNGFVAKFADAGTTSSMVWVQRLGGAASDEVYGLAVSGSSVYAAGYFRSATIGLGSTTLTNAGAVGTSDVFVAKLTDAGPSSAFTWAQRAGGTADDLVRGLVINGPNVYVAGYFYGSASGFGNTTLVSAGDRDPYVAKLIDAGSSGSFAWAKQAGGAGIDGVNALAISGSNIYISGYFYSVAPAFGNTVLANAGTVASTNGMTTNDVFVAKLTDAGSTANFAWAQQAGGPGFDNSLAMAASRTGLYVSGVIAPPARFGSQTITGSAGVQSG